MKSFLPAIAVLATVALAAPSPLALIAVPPPSPDLAWRCRAAEQWHRYGSPEACEEEKRLEELVAFQQARSAAERLAGQSDEKILKALGFDGKVDAPVDEDAVDETEPGASPIYSRRQR
jgi:hypothetical protein